MEVVGVSGRRTGGLSGGGRGASGEGLAVTGQQQVRVQFGQFGEAVQCAERGLAVVGETAAHDRGPGPVAEPVGGDQRVAGEEQPAVAEGVRGAAGRVAGQGDGPRGAGNVLQHLVAVEHPRTRHPGRGEGTVAGQP